MIRSQSFGRLRVALLAVGCFVGAGHSQAADAAVLIDSFTSCSPDFFSSLEANVTALGPSTVHESGDADPMQGGAAMFAAPVEVRGLHLTSFIQATPQKEAPTRYYRWGFQVTETPEVAAKPSAVLRATPISGNGAANSAG